MITVLLFVNDDLILTILEFVQFVPTLSLQDSQLTLFIDQTDPSASTSYTK